MTPQQESNSKIIIKFQFPFQTCWIESECSNVLGVNKYTVLDFFKSLTQKFEEILSHKELDWEIKQSTAMFTDIESFSFTLFWNPHVEHYNVEHFIGCLRQPRGIVAVYPSNPYIAEKGKKDQW